MSNIDFDKTTVHEALPVVGQNFPPVPPNVGAVIVGSGGSGINFPLLANLGGTGFNSFQVGDILYADTISTLAKLPVSTNGFVLTLDAGLPKWAAIAAIGVIGGAGTAGKIPKFATAFTIGDSLLSESGTTITVTGNVAISLLTASQYVKTNGANLLVSAATIPSADISNTSFVTSVTGTASRITASAGLTPAIDISASYVGQTSITTLGTITTGIWNGTAIGPTSGGTGLTSYTSGSILYASASNVLSALAASTNGFVLTLVGGFPAWATPLATIGGSGTAGKLPKFATGTTLADSLLTETAGLISINGALTVKGTGTGTGVGFLFEDSAGTDRVTILDNGKVGIGVDPAAASAQLVVAGPQWDAANQGNIYSYDSSALGIDKGGGILFGGYFTGTTPTVWASISGLKEDATDGNFGGYLRLSTRPNGGTLTERLRVDAAGNIGVGVSATAKFQVKGSGTGSGVGFLFEDSTGADKLTVLDNGNTTLDGNFTQAVGKTFAITSGSNQRAGNATLVGGTVTVNNTTVTANTVVSLTRKTSGGTIGMAVNYTLSAGNSFTITSDNILDTSVYSYLLIEVP